MSNTVVHQSAYVIITIDWVLFFSAQRRAEKTLSILRLKENELE